MRHTLALTLLSLFVVVPVRAQVSPKQCSGLDVAPPKAETFLPMVNLTPADLAQIKKERACQKGYLYPGGDDALLKASSSEIRSDLQHLQDLFDKTPQDVKDLTENDQQRVLKIQAGWNREQVLLFGNFMLIRALNIEKQYDQALAEVARIRKEFGLKIVPPTSWDRAQQATYFSSQALRNIIVAMEYKAKGSLVPPSGPERDELVKSYLADEPALAATMPFTHSAARAVLAPVCAAVH